MTDFAGKKKLTPDQLKAFEAMDAAVLELQEAVVAFAGCLHQAERPLDRDGAVEEVRMGASATERIGWAGLNAARRMREFVDSFPGIAS